MGGIDTLISIIIVLAFITFIGSKIYQHEKESIDPIIQKIKSWFVNEDDYNGEIGPNDDFELAFRGQAPNY